MAPSERRLSGRANSGGNARDWGAKLKRIEPHTVRRMSHAKAPQQGPTIAPSLKAFRKGIADLPCGRVVPLTGFEPVTPSLRRPSTASGKASVFIGFWINPVGYGAYSQPGPTRTCDAVSGASYWKCFGRKPTRNVTCAGPARSSIRNIASCSDD